jgi:N-hydroxyarylamine O-acetyltransferase
MRSGEGKRHDAAKWSVEELDVGGYLARVGYGGPTEATEEVLRRLHRAHVGAIPFENLDIVLGREIRVDLPSIQEKLLRRSRGGYCFEHNLLFAALLERLGFAVARLAGRVRMGNTRILPSTHMTLNVLAGGETWLADVGFGGEGLLEPVPLADGATSKQDGRVYGLVRETEHEWVLRSSRPDGWIDLYSFTLEPRHHADYFVANYYTSTHPRSPFTRRMVVQIVTPDRRLSLADERLVETDSAGTVTTRDASGADLGTLLRHFGIVLAPEELGLLHSLRLDLTSET